MTERRICIFECAKKLNCSPIDLATVCIESIKDPETKAAMLDFYEDSVTKVEVVPEGAFIPILEDDESRQGICKPELATTKNGRVIWRIGNDTAIVTGKTDEFIVDRFNYYNALEMKNYFVNIGGNIVDLLNAFNKKTKTYMTFSKRVSGFSYPRQGGLGNFIMFNLEADESLMTWDTFGSAMTLLHENGHSVNYQYEVIHKHNRAQQERNANASVLNFSRRMLNVYGEDANDLFNLERVQLWIQNQMESGYGEMDKNETIIKEAYTNAKRKELRGRQDY